MGVIIYQGYGEEKEVLYNSYAKKVVGKYLVRKIDEKVGSLVIEKIKMDLPFYEETSKKNNVNQNIFYIKMVLIQYLYLLKYQSLNLKDITTTHVMKNQILNFRPRKHFLLDLYRDN